MEAKIAIIVSRSAKLFYNRETTEERANTYIVRLAEQIFPRA